MKIPKKIESQAANLRHLIHVSNEKITASIM